MKTEKQIQDKIEELSNDIRKLKPNEVSLALISVSYRKALYWVLEEIKQTEQVNEK